MQDLVHHLELAGVGLDSGALALGGDGRSGEADAVAHAYFVWVVVDECDDGVDLVVVEVALFVRECKW